MTDYCPNCGRADGLSTPRSPTTILGKRNTKSVGIRICSNCDLILPKNKNIKFWTGKNAVSFDDA